MVSGVNWPTELGRVHILFEVSLLSQHLALPREGHLEQVLHIFGFLKENKKLRILFDCSQPEMDERWFKEYEWSDYYRYAEEKVTTNMPEARGLSVTLSMFVDASHAGNKNRRSQTKPLSIGTVRDRQLSKRAPLELNFVP